MVPIPTIDPPALRRLGVSLAFVAGAANAAGFLFAGRYTSHMTGFVSGLADLVVTHDWAMAKAAVCAVAAFLLGAATTAALVDHARRRQRATPLVGPLALEACLLLGLAVAMPHAPALAALGVLAYVMGLQNALMSKLSRGSIRTTHMTGVVTDLGIALGRWLSAKVRPGPTPEAAPPLDTRLHVSLLAAFFAGGLVGAAGAWHLQGWIFAALAALVAGIATRVRTLGR